MTFVVFLLILSVLVLIHELGHFVVARKNGIKVEEFGLGIPPRIIGKKIKGTLYSLNLLPFGGFVKLYGEDYDDKDALEHHNSFVSKKPGQRAAVLLAGVCMNFLLGAFLYYIFFFSTGFKTSYIPLIFDKDFVFGHVTTLNTVVTGFAESAPIASTDIEMGEAILQIDGAPVSSALDVRNAVSGKLGQDVSLLLLNLKSTDAQNNTREVKVKPFMTEGGDVILGVYLTKSAQISYNTPFEKIFSGFLHSYNVLDYSVKSFGEVISISMATKNIQPVSQSVSGPVGIYNVVGGILDYSGSKIFLNLLDFTALMSLSLALVNILPFPALDGGRLLFVVIEKIRRGKKLNPRVEATIHSIGMFILLGMIVLISIKDLL